MVTGMRLYAFPICLVTLFMPLTAQAGAWMRKTGKTFSAVSFNLNALRNQSNSTFLEFGLRDTVTIGVDIGASTDNLGATNGKFTLFLRRPLGPGDRKHRLSYEIGLGADWQGRDISPHLRAGVSWGRGITLGEKSDWAAVDASYTFSLGDFPDIAKIDTTFGLNFNDRFSGMMQLYLGHSEGTGSASFAPSLIISSRQGKVRYQVGFESPIGDARRTSIKIGLWREF